MRACRCFLAVVGLSLVSSVAWAGGWTQEEGAYYAKVWGRALVGENGYFADRESRTLADPFTDLSLGVYGEYGLTPGWTLLATGAPVGYASAGEGSALYVGPLVGGVRRAILTGDVRLAVEGRYGFAPGVGDKVVGQGVVEGQPYVYRPALLNHQGELELQVGWGWGGGWLSGSAGAQASSAEGVDPAVIGSFQVGVKAWDAFVFDMQLWLREPLGDVTDTNVAGVGQTRYLGVGLGASWWFSQSWGLRLGLEGVFYAASNAAAAPLTLAIEHKGF